MSTSRHALFPTVLLVILTAITSLQAVQIRFLAWDNAVAERKLGFLGGPDLVEIPDLHPYKRSRAVKWTPGEVPPVLVALDRPGADGKPVTAPIKLTADLQSPLVLILPDPKHPSGVRCFVIEDSASSFGWGTFRFINATGKELLVRNDKETKSLPDTWKAIDINPGGAARNMAIQMAARDNLTAVLYSAVWEYEPEVRKLIIVVPGTDAQSGVVDLKIIPEDRRALAPVAPETAVPTP
jgi:hypothetical protein